MGKADKISVVKKVRHAPLAEQIESEGTVTATGRVKNRRKRDPDQQDEVRDIGQVECATRRATI